MNDTKTASGVLIYSGLETALKLAGLDTRRVDCSLLFEKDDPLIAQIMALGKTGKALRELYDTAKSRYEDAIGRLS